MFDIGFSELVVVAIIALVVLGPEKLPGALRTAGLWIGRLRRSFNNIKADIEREVGADEIRRQLRNEAIMEKIKNTRSQVTQSVEAVRKEADAVKKDLTMEKEFKSLSGQDSDTGTTRPPPPPPPPGLAGENQGSAGTESAAAPEPPPAPQPQPGGEGAGQTADGQEKPEQK